MLRYEENGEEGGLEFSRWKDEPCTAKAKGRMSSEQFCLTYKDHSSPFPALYIHVIIKLLGLWPICSNYIT